MPDEPQTPPKVPAELACALAVLVTATSAVLIKQAQSEGLGSLWVATLRMGFAALIVLPFGLRTVRRMPARDALPCLLSGVFLALHFASWIKSLEYTSVLISVVLVSMAPLFVALSAPFITGDRPGPLGILGIVIATLGSLVAVGIDGASGAGGDQAHVLGAVLALGGAVAIAGHWMIGRRLRREHGLLAYIGVTYPVAAVILVTLALPFEGLAAAQPFAAWGWCLLLALGPQLLGHSTFNWALRHIPAPRVATIVLLEPVGAALLAWGLFGATEQPALWQVAGAALVLLGVRISASGGAR